jgi:hypothetical protein
MPARLRVIRAFLSVVVLCSFVPGTQAQAPENAREQYCGRTSCRELAQVLTTAVATAKDQFEASRSRLRTHEVHLKGPFSRLVASVREFLGGAKTAAENKKKVPQTVGSTGPEGQTTSDDTVSVYNAHDVERLLSSTEKALIRGLKKNSDLDPVAIYAHKKFPHGPPQTQIRSGMYVKVASGDHYFDGSVEPFLSRMSANGPGPVNLHFKSTPEAGANIVLTVSKGHTRSTVTPGDILGLVPGWYDYEVKKDGFKTGADSLDLADDPRENVECHLQLPTSSQTTICAQFGGKN